MNNIITAVFPPGETSVRIFSEIWQWDYGQILRIQGLSLDTAVEIHFAQEDDTESETRLGVTRDNTTDVPIPDDVLKRSGTFYAYVYVTDKESGQTEYKITFTVKERAKPQPFNTPEDAELFREAIQEVNKSADRAEAAEKSAEAWSHGRKDMPERAEDNAAYYAGQAKDAAASVPGKVEEAKRQIDEYITGKEAELKGDTGNVHFAAFKVIRGRLKGYSDPNVDKVRFVRHRSRLAYRLTF